MAGAPVALHKPPGAGHVDGVPRVAEPVILKLDAGLVAGRLTVALDHYAVETGIAEINTVISTNTKILMTYLSCYQVACRTFAVKLYQIILVSIDCLFSSLIPLRSDVVSISTTLQRKNR